MRTACGAGAERAGAGDRRRARAPDPRARRDARGAAETPSPHWLRHSHGTHAHRAGTSTALIRDTLGHASIATTDAYLRSSPDDGSGFRLERDELARPAAGTNHTTPRGTTIRR